MNKKVLLAVVASFFFGLLTAQTFKDIYQKSLPENHKIDLASLREGDVIWSKRYVRVIDLREKANHALYYPVSTLADGRRSFVTIIMDEIKSGKLNVYDPLKAFNADSVVAPTTYADIEKSMGGGMVKKQVQDLNGGPARDTSYAETMKKDNVKQLRLYEEWFFDKKHSKLDVRILGICPIYFDVDATGNLKPKPLFWLRYDDVREALSKYEVFNSSNDAQRVSFDDVFVQRRFSSYIIAESNVYNDRYISEYLVGKEGMYEAERIKNELFKFEHDLWEY
jgi:gliding motility associated protien GldN